MPFAKRARFVLANDGDRDYAQSMAYGVDYEEGRELPTSPAVCTARGAVAIRPKTRCTRSWRPADEGSTSATFCTCTAITAVGGAKVTPSSTLMAKPSPIRQEPRTNMGRVGVLADSSRILVAATSRRRGAAIECIVGIWPTRCALEVRSKSKSKTSDRTRAKCRAGMITPVSRSGIRPSLTNPYSYSRLANAPRPVGRLITSNRVTLRPSVNHENTP